MNQDFTETFDGHKDNAKLLTPKRTAYLDSIRLLARRDYSQIKLTKKLRELGHPQTEVEEAISTVLEEGYLREEEYIRARVRGFMHKNWSASHIKQKLMQEELNVDMSYIESIMQENGIDQDSQIQELIRKKIPSNLPKISDYDSWQKLKRKLISSLANKGHSPSKCFDAVNKMITQLKNS